MRVGGDHLGSAASKFPGQRIGQPSGLGGITLRRFYTQRFNLKPCGAGGSAIPNKGLAPGEFFTNAIVTLQFDSVTSIQQPTVRPVRPQPARVPRTHSRPASKARSNARGQVVTRKGAGYTYVSGSFAGKPVPGDIPISLNETKLVLKFPRVPYLPWQLVQPYVGKVNSVGVLPVRPGVTPCSREWART